MSLNFEGKAPDLVFYTKKVWSQKQEVGFLVNQQTKRNLFSDKEGKNIIGSSTSTEVSQKDDTDDTKAERIFYNISYSLFSLGSFIVQSSGSDLFLNNQGRYSRPDNTTLIKTITSGNGNFIGATGYVVTIKDESPNNKNLVYFTHI